MAATDPKYIHVVSMSPLKKELSISWAIQNPEWYVMDVDLDIYLDRLENDDFIRKEEWFELIRNIPNNYWLKRVFTILTILYYHGGWVIIHSLVCQKSIQGLSGEKNILITNDKKGKVICVDLAYAPRRKEKIWYDALVEWKRELYLLKSSGEWHPSYSLLPKTILENIQPYEDQIQKIYRKDIIQDGFFNYLGFMNRKKYFAINQPSYPSDAKQKPTRRLWTDEQGRPMYASNIFILVYTLVLGMIVIFLISRMLRNKPISKKEQEEQKKYFGRHYNDIHSTRVQQYPAGDILVYSPQKKQKPLVDIWSMRGR